MKQDPLSHSALAAEELPVPFGDHFDAAIGHFDGGVIVDRIRRHGHGGGPLFCVGHGIVRHFLMIDVRENRKLNRTKSSPMPGVITMLQALSPT